MESNSTIDKMMEIKFRYQTVEFSPAQYQIVTLPISSPKSKSQSHTLVSACAGSGKTRILICRIAYLIEKYHVDPSSIMILTFTRNSAEEIKSRLFNLLGEKGYEIYCGTFHHLSLKVIQEYKYKQKSITNTPFHIDETQYLFFQFLSSKKSEEWKKRIKYLLVDEYQDINSIQNKIINKISSGCRGVFMVGDINQNIYSFRGSNIKYFNKLSTKLSKSKKSDNLNNHLSLHLLENFRSSPEIIALANQIRDGNDEDMHPMKAKTGVLPILLKFKSRSAEISFIIEDIKKNISQNHILPSEIAILCRNNHPLYQVEAELYHQKIKCSLLSSEYKVNNRDDIVLSSIHSVKGLEWKYVYLMGMNDAYFPSPQEGVSLEEEKRLLYVAVTRCKHRLVITYHTGKKGVVSRFLAPIEAKYWHPDSSVTKKGKTHVSYSSLTQNPEDRIKNVTSVIKMLDGEDYLRLKKKKYIPDISSDLKKIKLFPDYHYPDFVKELEIYSEFGCFIDYLIRRMIYDLHPDSLGNHDDRAEDIILTVPLTSKVFPEYQAEIEKYQTVISGEGEELPHPPEWVKLATLYKQQTGCSFSQLHFAIRSPLPEPMGEKMRLAWGKYTSDLPWSDIVYEIYLVSQSHTLSSSRKSILYKNITSEMILQHMDWYQQIFQAIKTQLIVPNTQFAHCNPEMSNHLLGGDADLLIEGKERLGTIIDFKNSSYQGQSPIKIEHLVQLLVYTQLAREKGYRIKNIGIFNPLQGYLQLIPVNTWNWGVELLDYLIGKLNQTKK